MYSKRSSGGTLGPGGKLALLTYNRHRRRRLQRLISRRRDATLIRKETKKSRSAYIAALITSCSVLSRTLGDVGGE